MDSSTHANTSANLEDRDFLGGLMINDSGSEHGNHIDLFAMSDTTAFYFKLFVTVSLCACVSIFGIVTNIINIIVFIRQGIFKDGGSPSLLGLAVSDLCCVISMLWLSISFAITLWDPPGISWNPWDITYLVAGWPHLMCAQITRMVTAYVAFERCICVVFPFKVKSVLTPRRSIIIIACMFVFCGLNYVNVFIVEQFRWRTDPKTNTSRLVIIVTSPHKELLSNIMYYINLICNSGSVTIVFLSTMITVSRVQLSKAWRNSMATVSSTKPEEPQLQNPNTSKSQTPQVIDHQNIDSNQVGTTESSRKLTPSKMQKELKLIRMIIFISSTFLICYLPDITYYLIIYNGVSKEIALGGKYVNLAETMFAFTFLMETINSSINIVIYYRMSTRYKQEFRILFGLK